MAEVPRHVWQIGWGPEKQDTFGPGKGKAKGDLDKYLTLQDPLIIVDKPIEKYTDALQVGKGHEWPSYRGVLKQMINIEIPVQPMDSNFMAMLLCMVFNKQVSSGDSNGYTHKCEWAPLSTTPDGDNSGPDAWITSLAILEDGNEKLIEDVACVGLTLRGEGANQIECGASLIASALGTDLTDYDWPDASTPDYIFNSACSAFTNDVDTLTAAQLLSWELAIKSPVDMNRAWPPAATEALRHLPQAWPLLPHPARGFTFNHKIRAESGNVAALRAALAGFTEQDIDFTFLGETITGSDPAQYHSLIVTIPKGVLDNFTEGYEDGWQVLDMNFDTANYDATEGSPIAVSILNGEAEYLNAET